MIIEEGRGRGEGAGTGMRSSVEPMATRPRTPPPGGAAGRPEQLLLSVGITAAARESTRVTAHPRPAHERLA